MQPGDKFIINYKETDVEVEWLTINAVNVFRITVNGKAPLNITRATKENGKKFWTSIPEGRQDEAEIFGPLIEAFYRSNQ